MGREGDASSSQPVEAWLHGKKQRIRDSENLVWVGDASFAVSQWTVNCPHQPHADYLQRLRPLATTIITKDVDSMRYSIDSQLLRLRLCTIPHHGFALGDIGSPSPWVRSRKRILSSILTFDGLLPRLQELLDPSIAAFW